MSHYGRPGRFYFIDLIFDIKYSKICNYNTNIENSRKLRIEKNFPVEYKRPGRGLFGNSDIPELGERNNLKTRDFAEFLYG